MKSSLLLPLVATVSCLLASLTVFCFIGHVATKLGIEIEEISVDGLTMAFTAYPGLLTTLHSSNLWSVLFFGMLLLLGIDSIFGHYDYIIAYGWHFFPQLKHKIKKQTFVLLLVILLFASNLLFVTTTGWWWMQLIGDYVSGDIVIAGMAV